MGTLEIDIILENFKSMSDALPKLKSHFLNNAHLVQSNIEMNL